MALSILTLLKEIVQGRTGLRERYLDRKVYGGNLHHNRERWEAAADDIQINHAE